MPVELMTPAAGLAHTRAGIAAVRAVLVSAELDAPVARCPGWTLRDLAVHVGNVQRWVVGAIVEGHPNTAEVEGPAEREALLAWYDEGASALLDVLAGTDPDTPCWSFGPKPRRARFWFRRQAHEHAVHALDARGAAGEAAGVDPALAADGIDEVVTVFFPRQVRLGRTPPLERSLALRVTTGPGAGACWVLAGDGAAPGEPPAEAEISGPAEALYLLLWHRLDLGDPRLTLDGDLEAARAVLATALVP